jgi:hypothetical protein
LLMMLVVFKNVYKLDNQAKHLVVAMNSKNKWREFELPKHNHHLEVIHGWKPFKVFNVNMSFKHILSHM